MFSLSVICDLWMRRTGSFLLRVKSALKIKVQRCGVPAERPATNTTVQMTFPYYCAEGKYLQSADLHFCPLSADFSEAVGSEGPGPVKFCFDDS